MTDDNEDYEELRKSFAESWLSAAKVHDMYLRSRCQTLVILAAFNGLMVLQEIVDTGWVSWLFLVLNGSMAGWMSVLYWETHKQQRKVERYVAQLEPMLEIWLEGGGVTQSQWESMYEQLEATSDDLSKP
jgi:hypothetical protein